MLEMPPLFAQNLNRTFGYALSTAILLVIASLNGLQAIAHPISLSSTIVDIQEDKLLVDMEIMLEDLVLYHGLTADGEMKFSAASLLEAAKKHRQFVLDYFTILNASGNRLTGTIESEELAQIEAIGVAQSEIMRRSIGYKIVYPLKDQKPTFLTFEQNFGGDRSALPALMDLHLLQAGLLVENPTQITCGRPHTIKLDWLRKSDGVRENFIELRKKREEQFRDRLGISSYTGLFSFLYITRFEVRHEVLIPLLTLEQWLPVPRKDAEFLEIEEQSAARDAIEKFFREKNLVTINGQSVEGKLTRLNFFTLDINDFALNAEPRRVSVHQARVGVILTFPSRQSPKSASVNWETFSQYAPSIRSVVLIGNEPPSPHYFYSKSTTFEWTGNLSGPRVEPVLAKKERFSNQESTEIIGQVLTNVYRAFDFRGDEEVYDSLATSVSGDLLRETYLRIKRSLLMAEQGGALSHATAVEVVSATPTADVADNAWETTWRVTGVTEHWGHLHTRVTENRAKLKFRRHEGAWKLEQFQILDEKRIRFETSIRGL